MVTRGAIMQCIWSLTLDRQLNSTVTHHSEPPPARPMLESETPGRRILDAQCSPGAGLNSCTASPAFPCNARLRPYFVVHLTVPSPHRYRPLCGCSLTDSSRILAEPHCCKSRESPSTGTLNLHSAVGKVECTLRQSKDDAMIPSAVFMTTVNIETRLWKDKGTR